MKQEHEREKVNVLATSLEDFVDYISDGFHEKYSTVSNDDKLYRLKLLIEEYQLATIASELLRLNKESLEEHQTSLLIARLSTALNRIVEYVENNQNDLFIFSGRIYTLKHYCLLFNMEGESKDRVKQG